MVNQITSLKPSFRLSGTYENSFTESSILNQVNFEPDVCSTNLKISFESSVLSVCL